MLTFKLLDCLERKGEGILISLDVKGAFDRVCWARLKNRLRAKGMSGRAYDLLHDYLFERYLQVVASGDASGQFEISSGVPQGAKWSPKLWNFDISEMEHALSEHAMLICYADDSGIWYEITEENRDCIHDIVNSDLAGLSEWAADNYTTFEPTKTHYALISCKRSRRYVPPPIMSEGVEIERKEQLKLVGYIFDEKMSWKHMIEQLAKKAKSRLGMLTRLRSLLDDRSMMLMYTSFIRPMLEYGSVCFMGAKSVHLDKLDAIQRSAEKIGRFKVAPLAQRRNAAAVALTCKMLGGRARGVLKQYVPTVYECNRHCHNTT